MKAAICTGYGSPDLVKVMDVPRPMVKKGELMIKVMASAVNSGDARVRGLVASPVLRIGLRLALGIKKPRKAILGVALAGEIVEIGEGVNQFKVGDQIFAMTGMRFGGHGQYAVLSEKSAMALKPKSALYEEAAVLPFGGTTALHFLRRAGLQDGNQVMIYGASGAVGTSAVQLANILGAEVTAVCSDRHKAVVSELGANKLLDYRRVDISKLEVRYDIIFDAVGKIRKNEIKHLLKPNGRFISVAGYGVASEKKEDLQLLAQLFDEGKLKAVIDRSFPLEEIALAYRYVDQGVKTGNVAITINHV